MITNTYLIKALDNFPYNMEDCVESLNYALTFDGENVVALCLMGKVQLEFFHDKDRAIDYLDQALSVDRSYLEIYEPYMKILLDNNQLSKARAFLAFAQKHIWHQKGQLLLFEAQILEREFKWKKAMKVLSKALENAYDCDLICEIDALKKRVGRKLNTSN